MTMLCQIDIKLASILGYKVLWLKAAWSSYLCIYCHFNQDSPDSSDTQKIICKWISHAGVIIENQKKKSEMQWGGGGSQGWDMDTTHNYFKMGIIAAK